MCVLVYVPPPVRCLLLPSCFCFHAQTVKATLAKKELQETFLEFDLLGVLKRWLQVMERGTGLVTVLRTYSCCLCFRGTALVPNITHSCFYLVVWSLLTMFSFAMEYFVTVAQDCSTTKVGCHWSGEICGGKRVAGFRRKPSPL